MQLTLLPQQIAQVAAPMLTIESVPTNLEIAPDRFFLVAYQGDLRWAYPVQFTQIEALCFFQQINELSWSLVPVESKFASDITGIPVYAKSIHKAVEQLMEGGANG